MERPKPIVSGLLPRQRREQAEQYVSERAELFYQEFRVAVDDVLTGLSVSDNQEVDAAIDTATREVVDASSVQDIAQDVSSRLLGLLAAVTGLALPAVLSLLLSPPGTPWLAVVGACVTSSVLAALTVYTVGRLISRLAGPDDRSRIVHPHGSADVVVVVVTAALLYLARQPEVFPYLRPWPSAALRDGWLHTAVSATFWSYTVFALMYLVAYALTYRAVRQVRTRLAQTPTDHLIFRLLTITVRLAQRRWPVGVPDIPADQVAAVRDIEDAALQFETDWMRAKRTGIPHIDQQARTHVRSLVSGLRTAQHRVLSDELRLTELRSVVAEVVCDIVLRRVDTAEANSAPIVIRRAWLRTSAALIMIAAGVLTLVVAVWQPGLPNGLAGWGAMELAAQLRPDGDGRQVLATVGGVIVPIAVTMLIQSRPLRFIPEH
ncbi:hypothetical protein [Catellatospora citrea]|uniref:hypothetical protein n=1 Tax=Catellatospora citrea TaxID=53366 RepID=UPI0011C3F9C3|nr:hypothetical protein [Catellatospora citrea]